MFVIYTSYEQADDQATRISRPTGDLLVRNGYLSDETNTVAFAFWRAHAELSFTVGDVLHIEHAARSSTTDGCPKITTCSLSKIEVCNLNLNNIKSSNSLYITCNIYVIYKFMLNDLVTF